MISCGGCLPKPCGGFYWVFKAYVPVLAGGDGQSYETAYHFKRSSVDGLGVAENDIVRDKYEDIYRKHYEAIHCTTKTRDSKIYDVFTFSMPDAPHPVYFEVTKYRQKK